MHEKMYLKNINQGNIMKKQIIYFLMSTFIVLSKAGHTMEREKPNWVEIHQKAKNERDPESAYKLAEAWWNGNQGLKQNTHKALRCFLYAKKVGNLDAENKLKEIFDLYFDHMDNMWSNPNLNGQTIYSLGVLFYKGAGTEKNNYKAYTCFEQLVKLDSRRKPQERTALQKKWLLKALLHQGVMLYNEEVRYDTYDHIGTDYPYEKLDESTKYIIRYEKAEECFKKAQELGSIAAKDLLRKMESQRTEFFKNI